MVEGFPIAGAHSPELFHGNPEWIFDTADSIGAFVMATILRKDPFKMRRKEKLQCGSEVSVECLTYRS